MAVIAHAGTGRMNIVSILWDVWENMHDDPKTVYPLTAYEVPPRGS